MSKNRLIVLILGVSLVLACSLTVGSPTAVPTATQETLPSLTALPTYTPYPTYTPQATTIVETASPVVQVVTATSVPVTAPSFAATLLRPNVTASGNTALADRLYYFEAQAGQRVSLTVIGDPRYQTFSLRDSDNDGLIGCDVMTQTTCTIKEYVLPYSGIYYVLVDRTFVDNYRKLQSCVNNPPYADWCYRGGQYTLSLTIH